MPKEQKLVKNAVNGERMYTHAHSSSQRGLLLTLLLLLLLLLKLSLLQGTRVHRLEMLLQLQLMLLLLVLLQKQSRRGGLLLLLKVLQELSLVVCVNIGHSVLQETGGKELLLLQSGQLLG